ncbi:MAG: hypothetical protein JNM27_08880 [Leptospirales bacterium]|nr:hypothetical protein [Leptospirales bacterium]
MASKKDKLGEAARKRLDESMGSPPARSNMQEFVREMRGAEFAGNPVSGDRPGSGGGEGNVQDPGKVESETTRTVNRSEEMTPSSRPDAGPPQRDSAREDIKSVSPGIQSSESGHKEHSRMELKKSRRDSIYNISSDIRLEDYTDGGGTSGGGAGGKARLIAGGLLVVVLGFGVYYAGGWLFGPKYMLAVSSQEITAENVEDLAGEEPSLSAGHDVHIRFQWPEEKLKATYLKVKVDRVDGGQAEEQAVLGQKPPRTANYVYFKGPLDPGQYHVEVLDESGTTLRDKEFRVR